MLDRVAPMGVALGRQANLQNLQSRLAQLTAEMSSGRKSDPAKEMGVGASLLYKLYGDIQQGEAIQNSTSLAGKRLEAAQAALSSVGTLMDEMSPEILKTDVLAPDGYEILASSAREMMASMADLLNNSWDGQNLFGGTDSALPPLASVDGMLTRVQTLLSDAVTSNGGELDDTSVTGLIDDVDLLYNDTGSDPEFYTLMYQSNSRTGDGVPSQIRIGAGETLSYDMRADNQTFKDAFQALSLLSMLDAPDTQLTDEARVALIDQAGELMRGARTQLTVAVGILGSKQQRLENVADIQARAVTAATAQINDLEGTDYYTVSDQINSLQIQLQATYSITAKLAQLSFVNYL